jgi:hypothetical protein
MKSSFKSGMHVMWSSKPYTQDYLDKEKVEADKVRQEYVIEKHFPQKTKKR